MPRVFVKAFQPFSSRVGIDTVLSLSFAYDPGVVAVLKKALRAAGRFYCQRNMGGWLAEHRVWFVEHRAWPTVRFAMPSLPDRFAAPVSDTSYADAAAAVPNDGSPLPRSPALGLFIGTGGTLTVVTLGGTTVAFADPSACASTRLQQSPLARLNGSQAVDSTRESRASRTTHRRNHEQMTGRRVPALQGKPVSAPGLDSGATAAGIGSASPADSYAGSSPALTILPLGGACFAGKRAWFGQDTGANGADFSLKPF
jgi:hypothetical protein